MSLDQLDLTDNQMTAVAQACGALQPQERDRFLRAIAHRLRGVMLGDGSLSRAIRAELDANHYLLAASVAIGKSKVAVMPGQHRRSKLLAGEPILS
jgi:hypothetical protein